MTHVSRGRLPQPRNHATFENGTKPRSQDGLDYMDPTLESHKTVANVLVMVEPASQIAVTAVLFVRTDGKRRNVTAAGTMSLFENAYTVPDLLLCVPIHKGVLCHVGGLKRLQGWTFLQTPQLNKHIINMVTWRGQSKHWNGLLGSLTRYTVH